MHKISARVKPWTYVAESQLSHAPQRVLSLYLALKTSLAFPFIWDKVVRFLASCLGEVGMDHCDTLGQKELCEQSPADTLLDHSTRRK